MTIDRALESATTPINLFGAIDEMSHVHHL
jgi:hypothetical protein